MFSKLTTTEGKEVFVNITQIITITRSDDFVISGVKTAATQLRMAFNPDAFIYVKEMPRDIRKNYFDRGDYIW